MLEIFFATCNKMKRKAHHISRARDTTSSDNVIYTARDIMDNWADKIDYYLKPDMTFMDFSAGDDYLCNLLRGRGHHCLSYDISPRASTIVKQDFLSLDPKEFSTEQLVIGWNPPFGYRSRMTRQFLQHALNFDPLRIYCVVQKGVKNQYSPGVKNYRLVHYELLPAKTSFTDTEGAYFKHPLPGTYIIVLDREEGYVPPVKKTLPWPPFVKIVRPIQQQTWHVPETLFVRACGWKVGQKIIWCDKSNRLTMIDPSSTIYHDIQEEDINNSM